MLKDKFSITDFTDFTLISVIFLITKGPFFVQTTRTRLLATKLTMVVYNRVILPIFWNQHVDIPRETDTKYRRV